MFIHKQKKFDLEVLSFILGKKIWDITLTDTHSIIYFSEDKTVMESTSLDFIIQSMKRALASQFFSLIVENCFYGYKGKISQGFIKYEAEAEDEFTLIMHLSEQMMKAKEDVSHLMTKDILLDCQVEKVSEPSQDALKLMVEKGINGDFHCLDESTFEHFYIDARNNRYSILKNSDSEDFRSHPIVIEVFNELGNKAFCKTEQGKFKIVSLPLDFDVDIDRDQFGHIESIRVQNKNLTIFGFKGYLEFGCLNY